MKKMLLLIGLVFAVNANAVSYSNNNVSIKDSMCYYMGASWTHPASPSADICFDIRALGTNGGGWDPQVYGSVAQTVNDHSGNYMVVVVDVFGVPANVPEVEFNYKKLTPVKYDHIINYDSTPAIVNGKRYWYEIYTSITSGNVKVRKPNGSVVDYVDSIYVK